MSRLSKATREKMARELVHHRYEEQGASLVAESQELFRQLYDFHYDKETRKSMTAIKQRIAEAFATTDRLTANVMGRRIDVGAIHIGTYECRFSSEVMLRDVLKDKASYSASIGLTEDTPLAARCIAFGDAVAALADEISVAYREASGALQQFSTGKKLAADWPEAIPVIGHLIPEDDHTLPVVQVAGLNMKFKLPPKA